MGIKQLAFMLLAGRAVAVTFTVWVLVKQVRLSKLSIASSLRAFRMQLFLVSLTILALNFVPTVIDLLTLFVPIDRPPRVSPVSIVYGLSNSLLTAVLAFFVWRLYRTAAQSHKR